MLCEHLYFYIIKKENVIMEEFWKTVEFASNYEISNLGKVRNKKTGQLLNAGVSGNGYKQVSLKFDETGTFKKQYVHRLVALMWLDNPENKKEVNHKNLDRTDNRAENLEWVTSSENQKHKYQNNPNYKTSNRKINQYDLDGNFIAEWDSIIAAARSLGIGRQGIDKCVHHNEGRVQAGGYKWEFAN